jgi:hypothetical protein
LAGRGVEQGLLELWQSDHLGNSVKAHVIDDRYRPMVRVAEIEDMKRKLEELGDFKASRNG